MTSVEFKVEAEGDAEGWEAHLADLDDDGQDEVVMYCPVCAEREFHTTNQPRNGHFPERSNDLSPAPVECPLTN